MTPLAPSMQAYFTDRLIGQRHASPNTIAAYRHTFQLLLRFVTDRTGTPPSALDIADLDAPLIAAFLDHLQADRGNTTATRNNRLAAIHSLFGYLALHHPEHADTIGARARDPSQTQQQEPADLPHRPGSRRPPSACDQTSWTGRRDHAMLALTIQTGLRISELIALNCAGHHTRHRRQRPHHRQGTQDKRTPLTPTIRAVLKAWLVDVPALPTSRCSRPAPAHDSAATRSNTASRSTSKPPQPKLPVNQRQAHHDAHAASHRRDAPAARRQRHHRDRPMARPRTDLDDEHLPARRHDPQTAGDRPHPTAQRQTRPLPAPRHAPRLPRSTLIMPTSRPPKPALSSPFSPTSA